MGEKLFPRSDNIQDISVSSYSKQMAYKTFQEIVNPAESGFLSILFTTVSSVPIAMPDTY
jgi:hypothetical protein